MPSNQGPQRSHALADRADVLLLPTASGASVELMRTSYTKQAFSRHAHEYLTLGVVLRGVGTIWVDGANQLTFPGEIVVIPAGEVHTGGVGQQAAALSYLAVHLPDDVLAACAEAHGVHGGGVPAFAPAITRDPAIAVLLRRLNTAMRRSDHAAADDALSAALGQLVRRYAETTPLAGTRSPVREPSVVRISRDIIEDCYADNSQTSLRALAVQTGVTPFYLVHVFTQAVGLSPHRYLIQTRVRRAARFLVRGIRPSFVAAMTGFADQSHLTTQFKRYVGTTPASYQRCLTRQDPDESH